MSNLLVLVFIANIKQHDKGNLYKKHLVGLMVPEVGVYNGRAKAWQQEQLRAYI